MVALDYCADLESAERVARHFTKSPVVGFDLEWIAQAKSTDGIKSNISLIQLACEERVALFHVGMFRQDVADDALSLVAPTLKTIMESPEIIKVGVNIKGDCTRLRNFLGIDSRGIVELSHLHNLVRVASGEPGPLNKRLVALAQQTQEHLGLPLWKGPVRSSNWMEVLDPQQIKYAASDAYAALHIYDVLEQKRLALDPVPPRPAFAELGLPLRLTEAAVGIPVAADRLAADEEDAAVDDCKGATASARKQPPPPLYPLLTDLSSPDQLAENLTTLHINDQVSAATTTTTTTTTPSASKPFTKLPHVVQAEAWAAEYLSQLPASAALRASLPQLRAYALWHLHQQSVRDIAKDLRDPPLALSTVASYVFEAVRRHKLSYDVARLRQLAVFLPAFSRMRYQQSFWSLR
ncbi:MAG: hypothetical protein M1826_001007 [Phylliscum demangeonii]|nr:MAG: hypothetical protein M1826_001007 [Phylliscum demangeonii]